MRIADKRVLALIKSFLKAGVMSDDGEVREYDTGTPQGGIVSPLLANIALSVLDEHFCANGCPRQPVSQRENTANAAGPPTGSSATRTIS